MGNLHNQRSRLKNIFSAIPSNRLDSSIAIKFLGLKVLLQIILKNY
jgi:hypothetical protein